MKTAVLSTILFLASIININAVTRSSVASGDWSNKSTWSGNQVPQCGDSIIITGGHTVTIVSQETYNCIIKIVVKGKLFFSNGNKLNLSCGSQVFIFPAAEIASPANGNSNRINICGLEYWSSANGKITGPSCLPAGGPNCAGVLPVELASFEVKNCEISVCLSWTTASERNASHVVIERMEDGNFIAIDSVRTIAKNGDSKAMLHYNYKDASATSGLNYYRLKQVDADHSFEYSKIVTVQVDVVLSDISVYPNPNNGSFFVRCNGQSKVSITNSFGNIVFENISSQAVTSVTGLTSGMYFMTVQTGGTQKVQRIVVQ